MLLSFIPISNKTSVIGRVLSVYHSGRGIKVVLLFIFLNLTAFVQTGYSQCTNADFSDGNFTGWTGTYGINYHDPNLACTVSNPSQNAGFLLGPNNDPCTDAVNHYCQIITTTAGGNDPFLAADGVNIPVAYPGGPGFSARIGNTWPNNGPDGNPDAESITYTYTPTANTDGFTYYYFPILNVGPGHLPAEQPYFHIFMTTNTPGDTIQCATLNVDASNAHSVGGFDSLKDNRNNLNAGKIFYKNWTPVLIPLRAYIGQPVHITFVTRSCDPGGCAGIHFAIAYIDAKCGPIALAVTPTTNCAGTSSYTLTAPAGAYTYQWAGTGVAGDTTQTVTVTSSGTYSCTMTTGGVVPCTFTMDTTVIISTTPNVHANFSADTVCQGTATAFTNLSTPAGQPLAWDFLNNGTTNSTSATPTYTFATAGTYPVKLTVGTAPCIADTIINVVVAAPPTSPFTVNGPVCVGQPVTVTYTGNGTGADTYTWNFNGGTVISGSGAGPYQIKWATSGTKNITLTVSAGTCTSTLTTMPVTITPLPTVTLTPDIYICPGGSTTLSPVAAPAGGTYLWGGGQTTPTLTVSPAATSYYNVVYTLGTCSASAADTVIVTKPNAGPDQTVTCAVLPGGSATMAATGAGIWTPAASGNPGTALITTPTSPTTTITTFSVAGTYSFIWTNASGCTDTAKVTVTAKPNAGPDQTVTCAVLPGGSATMAATGAGTWTATAGNPGTMIITNPTSPTTTITGFTAAGVYSVDWVNASGCSDTAQITVTAKPNAGPDKTVNCAILPGGSATMAATGAGTWTPASVGNPGTAVITNPTSPTTTITTFSVIGTYSFVWTNASGCTDTAQITVTAKPDAGPDQTVTCAILPGGSATMAALGAGIWTPASSGNPGTAVITTPTSPTTTITTYTAPGMYSFVWTNASGCTDTAQIVVTDKPNAGPDKTVNCAILPGGSATMVATGAGIWSPASTGNPGTAVITSPTSPTTTITTYTAPGIYSFVWTNALGCTDTAQIIVTDKPNAGPDQTVTCLVFPDGTATMAATGAGTWTPASTGNPGTAVITTPTSPTTTITTFTAAGIYSFVWTNALGCTDTAQIIITAKPNAGPDQTVNCTLLPGGTATMAGTGAGIWTPISTGNPGTAIITSPTSPTTTITTYTAAGIYSFIWTNASGCTDTALITVTQEPTVTLTGAAYCNGGSATLTPIAAPAGGTYLWSTTQTTPTITTDTTVTASISVTYTLGSCPAIATATVMVYQLPTATVTTIPAVCTTANGIAIANPAAGTPTYSYSWSAPGGTRDSLRNLTAGAYQVTVTDAHQCTVTATGTVALQTPAIMVNEVSQHDLKCFNDATGDIYISTTDTARNAPSYADTYIWSNNATSQDLLNVQAGSYQVTVTDQFGCTGSATYTLTQPQPLTGTTVDTNPICYGYANGTAAVTPVGGSGTYHYVWNTTPVQTTQEATGLKAGSYTVTVKDDSLCTVSYSVTLTNPLQITFGSTTAINPSCYLDSNGTALVTPQNGIGTYTYAWSYNGETTNPAINLPNGTYTVTVTDSNGCFASTSVTLVQPPLLTVSTVPANDRCFGSSDGSAKATATGGTPNYSFYWSNEDTTPIITSLTVGLYTVTATDHNGCKANASANITQPTPVAETLSSTRTNCPNSDDGTITATGSGGTGAFTYTLESHTGTVIQSGNTTGSFTGVGYGLYMVQATDQNGCPTTDTITVPRAPFDVFTDSAVSTSCYGTQYKDGKILLSGLPAINGPFQYSIDGGPFQVTPNFLGLSSGAHQVTTQDAYGCDTTFTVTVPEPLPAVLQILPADSTIMAGASLQLTSIFGPYSVDSIKGYLWSQGYGLNCMDCPSPVASPYDFVTTYTLSVTYNQGCIVVATAVVNIDSLPPVYIPNAFSPNGDDVNDIWFVFGVGIKDIKVMVFNRWGEKVFETDDQFQGWDGTFKGVLQPPGVYVYVAEMVYLSGQTREKHGSVTLIR